MRLTAAVAQELKIWKPLPGPQTQAYYSKADILFYGGAAGGGKTDLLLGLAHTAHRRTSIFRREYPQLKGIEDRALELFGALGEYNISNKIWRLFDGRMVEFGAVKDEKAKEKYAGRPHDLKGFDEITHFLYSQFIFLTTWVRSTIAGQRTRIVCTGNPPVTAEGDWVIDFWGAWLDEKHPNPALPGELRWYTNLGEKTVEVPTGEPFLHDGQLVQPLSRTFIPASIDDNPYLRDSGYKATLQALPRELREKFLDGNFKSSREDHPKQTIPSEWVYAAQERWRQRAKPLSSLSAIGVDIARGGANKTVLSPRYGNYFAEQLSYPGNATPDGPAVAQLVMQHVKPGTMVNVDVCGVGSSPYDALMALQNNITAREGSQHSFKTYPCNSAAGSDKTDKSGLFGFINKRAEWWWLLREALDPETGDDLALPDDRELYADLCAPRYEITVRGIKIESKDDIIERIGRSPDKGDSLVYAHAIEMTSFAFDGI